MEELRAGTCEGGVSPRIDRRGDAWVRRSQAWPDHRMDVDVAAVPGSAASDDMDGLLSTSSSTSSSSDDS